MSWRKWCRAMNCQPVTTEPRPVITIDGPVAAGKTTVARLVAARLDFSLLDTGAIYRCVALCARRLGIDWNDSTEVAKIARHLAIGFHQEGDLNHVILAGEDVSTAIRTPAISQGASIVSALPTVREALLELQRDLGRAGGIVAEGRDTGTVIFPQAEVKFFLLASAAERGRRRYEELRAKGLQVDLQQTITEVEQRDAADCNRQHAPLLQADDALAIDTTAMTIDQVLQEMLEIVTKRRMQTCEA